MSKHVKRLAGHVGTVLAVALAITFLLTLLPIPPSSDSTFVAFGQTPGSRDSSKDFNTLKAADNISPSDIWSDGTTMWVGGRYGNKVFAYKMSDKSRDSSKDFNNLASSDGNPDPKGVYSDGTTMWVADVEDDKIYAYKMSDKSRDSSKDITLHSDNDNLSGLWGNGTTIWVTDRSDYKVYAYTISTGARDSNEEFDTPDQSAPGGIWSDGITIYVREYDHWVTYQSNIRAYNMSDKSRDTSRDYTTLNAAGNTNPRGIWSNGTTMWAVDIDDEKIYAYHSFSAAATPTPTNTPSPTNTPTATPTFTPTATPTNTHTPDAD